SLLHDSSTVIGHNINPTTKKTFIIPTYQNVGFGTLSPVRKLDVNGSGRFSDSLTAFLNAGNANDSIVTTLNGTFRKISASSLNTNSWSLTGNASINPNTNFLGTTGNQSLRFRTNNTQKMILDSIGNLGLGVNTPDAHLSITGSGSGTSEFLKINTTSSSGRPITIYQNGTFVGGIDYDFSNNYFSFDVVNAGLNRVTNAFVIMSETNNNYVGLGTTTPTTRLDVAGIIKAGQTAAFKGTKNTSDADTFNIGEYISATVASGSAVGLTTATPANVTSISLTAGD